MFKPKLGRRYSVAWKNLGFLNNTLALPRTMCGRVGQVRAIQHYLEAHPELEIPAVLTAAIAEEIYTLGVTTMSDLGIAQTTLRQKIALRNAALSKLDKRTRNTFQELRMFLPANDPRWLEFGFNIPDDKSIPAAPTGLKAQPSREGSVSASWEAPVNSDRFRIYSKVLGRDEQFGAVDSTTETTFYLTGLPSGSRVQIYVTAINKAGESVASEIVEVLVM
jgi:hypothetical protein